MQWVTAAVMSFSLKSGEKRMGGEWQRQQEVGVDHIVRYDNILLENYIVREWVN